MTTNKRSLDYYMSLPYKVEISPEEDGTGFNASISDLKGCVAFGETVEEAYQTITEVKQTWIEIALERGWRVPEPSLCEDNRRGVRVLTQQDLRTIDEAKQAGCVIPALSHYPLEYWLEIAEEYLLAVELATQHQGDIDINDAEEN